ncbi:MAG: DMT family transporter [Paracoccaceae bacterium]|nr:DMT family transporter [Paracoccaceae bacterium]
MDHTQSPKRPAAGSHLWALLISAGLLWGVNAPISQHAVSTGHHPLVASFWNVLTAALAITGFGLVTRQTPILNRQTMVFFGVTGLAGRAVPIALIYVALTELPVSVVVLLISTTPLLTLLGALLGGSELLSRNRLIGLVLGLLAVGLVLWPSWSSEGLSQPLMLLVPLVVAASYAFETLFIKRYRPPALNSVQMVIGSTWAASLMLLPFSLRHDTWFIFTNLGTPEAAVVGGAIFHLSGYLLFVTLIDRAGAVFASQVGYVVTISGVLLGVALMGENPSPSLWVALIALLLGLSLVKPQR